MSQEAMEFPEIVKKESGCSFCYDCYVCQNKVYSLGDRVYDSHNGVMSGGLQEFDHEIDAEHIPPYIWNGEQLKLINWRVLPGFCPETEIIGTYIL